MCIIIHLEFFSRCNINGCVSDCACRKAFASTLILIYTLLHGKENIKTDTQESEVQSISDIQNSVVINLHLSRERALRTETVHC